jgi:hypothetical protein
MEDLHVLTRIYRRIAVAALAGWAGLRQAQPERNSGDGDLNAP